MAEETKSLLYKVKPISDRLPAVKRPEGEQVSSEDTVRPVSARPRESR